MHLLRPASEGHVGVAGAGAIPLLLLDVGDEGAAAARFPLATPVVEHLLDQLVVLLQQEFGLLETDELQAVQGDNSYVATIVFFFFSKLCSFKLCLFHNQVKAKPVLDAVHQLFL